MEPIGIENLIGLRVEFNNAPGKFIGTVKAFYQTSWAMPRMTYSEPMQYGPVLIALIAINDEVHHVPMDRISRVVPPDHRTNL